MNDLYPHIEPKVKCFLLEHLHQNISRSDLNSSIYSIAGINDFFNSEDDLHYINSLFKASDIKDSLVNRREFGDFQTNPDLASKVVDIVFESEDGFEFILEPTCGKGNFIIAALNKLKSIKKLIGIEIYKPYIWETKFNILNLYLSNPGLPIVDIDIIHANIFEYRYNDILKSTKGMKTLIIGNPPWITNSELGTIESSNLPKKSNLKNLRGLDAITGKGNFDIGEYILCMLIRTFQKTDTWLAVLVKNTVIKNIIYEQRTNNFNIAHIRKFNIDAKKEFNVSVSASLFLAKLQSKPSMICGEYDFYTQKDKTTFGWYKDKFVSSIDDYDISSSIEGYSSFIWRSGIKHDCSSIMELEKVNGHYTNGLKQEVKLENELVYGILKSSDLKKNNKNSFRKVTIMTQKRIGQNTNYIRTNYPLTYNYLSANKDFFNKRKSSIYKGKPNFSIFGVGDYSFELYKVAISGLYKSTHFTLVSPHKDKPVMLDDTCYFIGFDNLKNAEIAHYLLNTDIVQKFLWSIIFIDAKRAINKDVLMRIDLQKVYMTTNFNNIKYQLPDLSDKDWKIFGEQFTTKNEFIQTNLF